MHGLVDDKFFSFSLSLSLFLAKNSSDPFFLSDFWAINWTTSRDQSLENTRREDDLVESLTRACCLLLLLWIIDLRKKEGKRETFLICRFVSLQNFLFLEGYKNEKLKNNASMLKKVYKAKHQGTSTKTELKTKQCWLTMAETRTSPRDSKTNTYLCTSQWENNLFS